MKVAAAEDGRGLRAWLARYLEWMGVKNHSPRYIETAKKHLGAFLEWSATRGLTRPEEITKPILERFQRYLFHYRKPNGRPLAYGTQHGRLVAIRGFFRWMAKQNAILWNPASDLELPRKGRRLPHHVLTLTEVERVLGVPNIRDGLGLRDRAILEVLFGTGMRRLELCGLGVYDLDIQRGTIHIRHGKGDKDRVVPIGERALSWLGKYMDVVRPALVVDESEEALFLTRMGTTMGADALTERVRHYVKDSGIGKRGACHIFRHSMATLMLEGGADVRFVQEMLGHTKLETTLIYTQGSISKLREVYMQTHPAAYLGRSPVRAAAREDADAEELLAGLAEEGAEEGDPDGAECASTAVGPRGTF